ncbi:hypothetical protein FVE88_15040 [Ectopseudomonas mendocina]|nr:hypothetical protein FVE88_15040 [Pseudomonas mendocina]
MGAAPYRKGQVLHSVFAAALGKDGVTPECIAAIQAQLKTDDFTRLMLCKMPGWMRKALVTL